MLQQQPSCKDKPEHSYQDEAIKSNTFVGLNNLGATGYINCVLHQLFHIKQFRYGILNAGSDLKLSDTELKDSLLYQTFRVFAFMSLSTNKTFDMTSFCDSYKDDDGKPINVNAPADTQEFLAIFLDRLENEMKNTKNKNLIRDTIGGQIAHVMTCKICNKDRCRPQHFFLVSLVTKNCENVTKSLQDFVAAEILDGVSCDTCNSRTQHEKGSRLYSLPNTLIIHSKRFQLNFETFRLEKVNTKWEIPDEINLKEYMKLEDNDEKTDGYFEYKLVGVIIHNGDAAGGQLYSLIKNRSDIRGDLLLDGYIGENYHRGLIPKGVMDVFSLYYHYYEWNYVFDDNIYPIDDETMKRHSFGGESGFDRMRNAYMVIFERKQFMDVTVSGFKSLNEVEECVKKSQKVWNEICNQ